MKLMQRQLLQHLPCILGKIHHGLQKEKAILTKVFKKVYCKTNCTAESMNRLQFTKTSAV